MIVTLPGLEPCAKARPRVTARGTYMPKRYQEWRKKFVIMWRKTVPPYQWNEPVMINVRWTTPTGNCRPDLDNAISAVYDALQDAGALSNDSLVRSGAFRIDKGPLSTIITIAAHV
jgi:Holliday junction resolvase RusA-like endonuclease